MRPLNGAPKGDANMGTVVKDLRNQVDVLSRRLSRLPKPDKPASGGIVDIAKFSTTATFPSFAGIRWPSGDTEADHFDTTYDTPTSTVTGDSVDWLTIDLGGITPTEDGFYQVWCWAELRWPSLAGACGTGATFYLNGRDTPGRDQRAVLESSGGFAGVSAYVTNGPEWMTTSDTWRLEVQGLAATSAALSQSTATWQITKYGAA